MLLRRMHFGSLKTLSLSMGLLLIMVTLFVSSEALDAHAASTARIVPGVPWSASSGKLIQAHGGLTLR